MKKVKITMYFDVEENCLEEIKKLEHHADYLLNLDEYPEINSVYGVKVEEIVWNNNFMKLNTLVAIAFILRLAAITCEPNPVRAEKLKVN